MSSAAIKSPTATEFMMLRRKAEIYDQLEAYGCTSAAEWLRVVDHNRSLRSLLERCKKRLMHEPGCGALENFPPQICTCGLSSLLTELDKELKP